MAQTCETVNFGVASDQRGRTRLTISQATKQGFVARQQQRSKAGMTKNITHNCKQALSVRPHDFKQPQRKQESCVHGEIKARAATTCPVVLGSPFHPRVGLGKITSSLQAHTSTPLVNPLQCIAERFRTYQNTSIYIYIGT